MSGQLFNKLLLLVAASGLSVGFVNNGFWIASSCLGLIPALMWVIADLKRKSVGSDLLAVLSLSATLLTGEYFAGAVISLMLATGRTLESWAEGQAQRQLKALLARIPRTVSRINSESEIVQISVDAIEIGDKVLVRSGEILAADGVLIGSATLDESALTGEPMPVTRYQGDAVLSGVVNAANPFEYTVSSTASGSTYAGIIELVKAAQARTSPGVRIANQWAIAFVPFSILFAGVAWIISGESTRAVAVLVAATPCPLILAVPIAVVSGLSNAAKHGAVIKGGAILEALARVETVLLDKTGTITHGGPVVSEVVVSSESSVNEVLVLAASVDQFSQNVIAHSLVEEAKSRKMNLKKVTEITEVHGHHISGFVEGELIVVGQLTQDRPSWLHLSHPLIVAVTKNGQLIGAIGLSDPIRPESRQLVANLKTTGVKRIALVTGDKSETAQLVADSVGITEVHSHVSAEGKLSITREAMQTSHGTVVVVGDGINDAPALAAADIGVAMGARGATAASEAADIVIVEDSIDRLTIAIKIAQRSRKKAVQAAGIGMALCVLVMAAGAGAILTPGEGAVAQELIDVIAIVWALGALRDK